MADAAIVEMKEAKASGERGLHRVTEAFRTAQEIRPGRFWRSLPLN
jgi:hypothetical protein